MKTLHWLGTFALLSACSQVAGNPLQQAMAQLDAMGNAFVQAANHTQIDANNLADSRYYTAATFPNATAAHTATGLPDAGLDALTRAVLLVHTYEAPLPHVRYRVEIPDAQAQADDCLGVSCLALANPSGPEGGWQTILPPHLEPALYASRSNWGVALPARVMEELWSSIAGQGIDPLPYQPDQPAFQFVIAANTDGQQAAVMGLAKQSVVLDSSVSEIWTLRAEAEQTPPHFSILSVPRR